MNQLKYGLAVLSAFTFLSTTTAYGAPDTVAVDFSQVMTFDSTTSEIDFGTLANDNSHPINRYDLFCQDHEAAKPSKDWDRTIPAILSSYVKVGTNEISPANAVSPGADYQCVGKEVLKRLYTNMSNVNNLHKFIKSDRRIKQTETRLTWTTSSGLEILLFGAKTASSVDLSSVDPSQRESLCNDLKGDFDTASAKCAGSQFRVNDFSIDESFWQLGQTAGLFTNDLFEPALNLERRAMLDQFNGLEWNLKTNFFHRLAQEKNTAGEFETYYYCQSSNTRIASSGDYGCGDNRTVWLDSEGRELVGTPTELMRSKEGLGESNSALKLHVIQTGPGNCVILECPGNNKALLIDCGSTSKRVKNADLFGIPPNFSNNTNADTERLISMDARIGYPKSLAHAQNILSRKGDIGLIVSHGDADHKNLLYNIFYEDHGSGVSDLYKNIQYFYFGGHFQKTSDDTKTNKFFERLFNHFDSTTGKFELGPDEDVGGSTVKTKRLPRFFASGGNKREDPYSRKPAGFKTYTTPLSTGKSQVCKVGDVGAEVNIVAANEYGRGVTAVKGVTRAPNPGLDWTKKNSHTTNGNSIILEIRFGGKRIVIPGDAERGALDWAVDPSNPHRITGQADILLAAHHGADGHGKEENLNITQNWVNALNPSYLVYTHGHQFGHPKLGTYGEADGEEVKVKPNTDSSPAYFSKCFKDQFGKTPLEVV